MLSGIFVVDTKGHVAPTSLAPVCEAPALGYTAPTVNDAKAGGMRRISGALLAALALLLSGKAAAEPAEASWYADELTGRPTASGEPYDPDRYTAASPDLAIGATLLVTRGERRVIVRVNDRGPYGGDRDLDLSRVAAEELDIIDSGSATVDARLLPYSGGGARAI